LENLSNFIGILKVLVEHKVDFIVVGGLGAVLHGAPIMTFDLDIVHSQEDKNLNRLVTALMKLKAIYREQPERGLKPKKEHLHSPGHHLLITKEGLLDILGAIGMGVGYDELIDKTDKFKLGSEMELNILNLKTIIEIKEQLGNEKDKAVLPILKRTLSEKSKKQ